MAKYSFEFKLHAVELYLSNEVSYQELANTLKLNNPSLLARWVNDFRAVGPDALRPHKKGRRSTVKNDKKQKTVKSKKLDTETATYIKQLEDELLKARIENAYLKELRRLRLEEEALLKQKRELSTVSEDNLD